MGKDNDKKEFANLSIQVRASKMTKHLPPQQGKGMGKCTVKNIYTSMEYF